MKKSVSIMLFYLMLNFNLSLWSSEETISEPLPFEYNAKNASDIIIGSVETIKCTEKKVFATAGDIMSSRPLKNYEILVFPVKLFKGNVNIKRDIEQKLIKIHFKGFSSPFLSPDSIYKPSLKTGFLNTTGTYIFYLEHIKGNEYQLLNKFSAIPYFPIKDVKTTPKNPWDFILMTLKNNKTPIIVHDCLFSFLIRSDTSKEKKKQATVIHKEYYQNKLQEIKNKLKKL